MEGKFVSYIRVSTARQGQSGLGLEAQQELVRRYLNGGSWALVAEFTEVESGRKGGKNRPQLASALAECQRQGAVLVIAKLDRLARDVRFFLEVLDDSKVEIRFVEFPDINPKTDEGRMLLINMANFAEFEGRRIGSRTRAALAIAKARGVKLGVTGPTNLRPVLEQRKAAANAYANSVRGVVLALRAQGLSQRAMVEELNRSRIEAPRGGRWHLPTVQRVMARLQLANPATP